MYIKEINITGLFGDRSVSLTPKDNCIILVGPNGIGKSTVINIIYFFISRQWSRLLEYEFSEIVVSLPNRELRASKSDINGISALNDAAFSERMPTPVRKFVTSLRDAGLLEDFLTNDKITAAERKRLGEMFDFPIDDVARIHRYLNHGISRKDGLIMSKARLSLESELASAFPGRTIYLPTYRRIEKDLREIFPDIEERYRLHASTATSFLSGRSSSHFVDLVSFGMDDVKRAINKKTQAMRDFSLESYNNLSGLYLRDVIRGTAHSFIARQITSITDEELSNILDRVNEKTLPGEDKSRLRQKVTEIRGKNEEEVDLHDRYLAHYFSRLVEANAEITLRESDISAFLNVCNAYLEPRKSMIYDEIGFTIKLINEAGDEIDISLLSSGEKQVVSLFSHLYLDDTESQMIVIDEPELSLSVPWQKRFLTDILASKKAGFVLAVTHSPFIYQNELKPAAVDLRRHTKTINIKS